MMMSKHILFLSAFILVPPSLYAGGTEGATPFNFLFLDAGARPAAMGGAYAAAAQDANALLYNPAGLAGLKENHFTFQHTAHFQDATQEYGALALKNGFGFMVNTLSFGKIQRTTISKPRGTGLGTFGIRDWVVSLGYGKSYKSGLLSLGIAGKYLRETIDTTKAQSGAIDAGILLDLSRIDQPFSLGIAVQNLGLRTKFQSTYEELPINFKAGIAYKFLDSGLFVLDVNFPQQGASTVSGGWEYVAFKTLALRAGYNGRNETDSGITAGGGIRFNALSVDYAFVPFGDLGNAHKFSVTARF